jgi:hypothetical protein
MKDDPAIVSIRKTRQMISGKFKHDIDKIIDHYITLQDKHKVRLITTKLKRKTRMAQ